MPQLSSSFCFLQYSLAFFILFITDGGTRSWCGWTTGQVDPLQFAPLSFITFSCSFLCGGNLIRRAITFSGHLSPCHLWKVLLENTDRWRQKEREILGRNEIASCIHRQKEWMTSRKGREKGSRMWLCVCVQSASFAAVQGVVCRVRLLNLSLAWQLLFVWRRSELYWVLNKSSPSLLLLKIARGVLQTCESSHMHSIERVSLWWNRSSMHVYQRKLDLHRPLKPDGEVWDGLKVLKVE